MLPEVRKQEILSLLELEGSVRVEDLAQEFSVTRQTIRNDLRALENTGRAARTHGGARRILSASNFEYDQRRKHRFLQKQKMGASVAALIPNDCSVALSIGTSTEHVAKALFGHRDLIVISNNINIVNSLIGSPSKQLILVGGSVRPSDGAVVGDDATEFISRFKVDFCIIGCSSLDQDGAVLEFDSREVSVARTMLANSRTRILVSDSSKFRRTAPVRICEIGDLDMFVTDENPPGDFQATADASETAVIVADNPRG